MPNLGLEQKSQRANTLTMRYVLVPFLFVLSIGLISCDDDVAGTDPVVTDVRMIPDSVGLTVGEEEDFSFELLSTTGEVVEDPNIDVDWWSTDSTVFTVDESGRAVAQDSGRAFCMVEVSDELGKSSRFVGRDSAIVVVFMF